MVTAKFEQLLYGLSVAKNWPLFLLGNINNLIVSFSYVLSAFVHFCFISDCWNIQRIYIENKNQKQNWNKCVDSLYLVSKNFLRSFHCNVMHIFPVYIKIWFCALTDIQVCCLKIYFHSCAIELYIDCPLILEV